MEFKIEFPIDNDGFIRRECPYCKRHFKLIYKSNVEENSLDLEPEENDEDVAFDENEDLFCPYCGQSADQDSLWTEEQVRFINEMTEQNLVNPMLDDFAKDLERSTKNNPLISFKAKKSRSKRPIISPEPNDMAKLELPCCSESLKIDEGWKDSVYCVICGEKYNSSFFNAS